MRRRWFDQYVATVLAREVAVADDIRKLDALAGLLRDIAATTSGELVVATAAQRVGVTRETAAAHLAWLETVFLVHRVPAWGRNLTAKVLKRPQIYVGDTGLAASLMGRQVGMLRNPTEQATGPLVETFVVNELAKQLTWSRTSARLHHLGAEFVVGACCTPERLGCHSRTASSHCRSPTCGREGGARAGIERLT